MQRNLDASKARLNEESKMGQGFLTVLSNEPVAERVYRMELTGELVKRMRQPGQFVHVKCGNGFDPLLRRPISICDVNPEEERLTLIYRVEGKGTRLLSQKGKGERMDLLGPLGRGFPVQGRKPGEKALLVGGGVGVPPLFYLAKELVRKGVQVYAVLGFGSENQAFLQDEFVRLGETRVTTIDGSLGVKGLVTDVLDEGFAGDWDVLYSCGPLPMLKALQKRYREDGREAYISIEQRMGCGVGACLACVVNASVENRESEPGCSHHIPSASHEKEKRKYYKICSDGPVFPLAEVVL